MSKLNFLVFLNTYSDIAASNNPSLSNFKWTRDVSGVPVSNPVSEAFQLAPGESQTLISGSRTLSSDNTTQWNIALKPLSSNTYILSATGGTAPQFRTLRAIASDVTTQVTVTRNGPLTIFTFTGGTLPDLSSVVPGDYVRIGDQFNQLNRGEYKILSKTTTSFSVENQVGVAEGPVTLGVNFASQVRIYSAAGVQVGDTLVISGGFSPVTQRSYDVTAVSDNFIEFYYTDLLPQEGPIQTTAIAIYSMAKSMVYVECDQKVNATINGTQNITIEPIMKGTTQVSGILMLTSTVYSLQITNPGTSITSIFLASVE